MLYTTDSSRAYVIVQYIIVEIDGLSFKIAQPFKNKYYEQEIDAYTDIAENGLSSVRYVVLPTTSIFVKETSTTTN